MPKCGGSLIVLFPALDLSASPSASVWINGFRFCKEATPLDYAEYTRNPRGAPCDLLRTGELIMPISSDDPVTITVRLNLHGKPGPERTFQVDLDDVEPDEKGCRVQYVSFQNI